MAGSKELTFEQARISVLRKVRIDTEAKIAKLIRNSEVLVRDCLPYETGYPQGGALTEQQSADMAFLRQGAEMMLEVMGAHIAEAVSALESGARVNDLLGVHSIPSYRGITGGDGNAGALSAVEDIAVLLMSLDAARIKGEIFEETIKCGTLSPDLIPRYENLLFYSAAMAYDHVLMGMADGITERLPSPRKIAYENGAVIERNGFLSDIFKALTSVVHHSVRDARRAKKIPKIWPPLKTGDVPAAFHGRMSPGHEDFVAVQNQAEVWEALRRFDHLGFQAGYGALVEGFYGRLQEDHFAALYPEKGEPHYAARLGLSALYESKTREVAVNVVSTLRDRIGELGRHIPAPPAVPEENVFSGGVLQAFHQIQDDIAETALIVQRGDKLDQQIIGRLKDQWRRTLEAVVRCGGPGDEATPEPPSSAAEPGVFPL